MEIIIDNVQEKIQLTDKIEKTILDVINKTAEIYKLPEEAEVGIMLVDDEKMRGFNRDYRGKDVATDVLSFALNEGDEPEIIDASQDYLLGDIIISLETAARQAEEYGHSLAREVGFLTVHGMLHLLGFDHIKEDEEQKMREQEEFILGALGISRE